MILKISRTTLFKTIILLFLLNLTFNETRNFKNNSDSIRSINIDNIFSSEGEINYGKKSNKTVVGFLPYWESESQNFDPLTHIAWFGIELNQDGTTKYNHGWPKNNLVNVIHSEGKKIILVASIFDQTDIHNLLTTPTYVNTTISNLLTQVQNGNADGICIDFEFPGSSDKTYLVNFMNQLNDAFKEANSSYHTSICTPNVDWSGAFDYDQLEPHIDNFILMGEGYYYSGSSEAGPTAPLYGGSKNLNWSVHDQITWGVPAEKIILRLPLYGRDYPVDDETMHSTSRGTGLAITYNDSIAKIASNNSISLNYNSIYECEWYNYWEDGDGWHQVWCENEESLKAKMDYIIDESLGGVSFWAWGYQGVHEDIENMIEYKFQEDTTNPVINIIKPSDGFIINSSLVQLEWQGTDNIEISHYSISWNEGFTWEIMNLETAKSINLTDGIYTFIVKATDTNDNTSNDTISFSVDTRSPLLDNSHLLIIIGAVFGIETVAFILRRKKRKIIE
jgi:spore germination protein YaaH